MFFGVDAASDTGDGDANLTRFQDSSSISSDMYFNREGASGSKSPSYINMQVSIVMVIHLMVFCKKPILEVEAELS